jgi:hypothetical protein
MKPLPTPPPPEPEEEPETFLTNTNENVYNRKANNNMTNFNNSNPNNNPIQRAVNRNNNPVPIVPAAIAPTSTPVIPPSFYKSIQTIQLSHNNGNIAFKYIENPYSTMEKMLDESKFMASEIYPNTILFGYIDKVLPNDNRRIIIDNKFIESIPYLKYTSNVEEFAKALFYGTPRTHANDKIDIMQHGNAGTIVIIKTDQIRIIVLVKVQEYGVVMQSLPMGSTTDKIPTIIILKYKDDNVKNYVATYLKNENYEKKHDSIYVKNFISN